MLILDRNNQQTLYIGDDITIKVLKVNSQQVRLGITVPKSILVIREELLSRNPNTLTKHQTDKQSHQEVVMQSGTENMTQPPKTPTATPKVVYKQKKRMIDRK